MMTLDEAIRSCEEVRKLGVRKERTDEYVQLAEWLKELKERREKEDNGNYRDGQDFRHFVLGENIYAVLMLKEDQNKRFYADDKVFLTPFTDIVLRLVMDRPGGKKERLDVVMSNEQAMAIRKALKQQVKRNGGWKKKRRETIDQGRDPRSGGNDGQGDEKTGHDEKLRGDHVPGDGQKTIRSFQ